jgi:phage-related protein
MKAPGSTVLTQAGAAAQAPVGLVALGPWPAGSGLYVRWTTSDAAVVFQTQTFQPRPFALGAVRASQEGADPRLTLTVAQPDLAVIALCSANDPAGVPVTVWRAFLDNLSAAQLLVSGLVIDGYRPTDTDIAFSLVPAASGLRRKIGRKIGRTCGWAYPRSTAFPECPYTGPFTGDLAACDRSDEACKVRLGAAWTLGFGGFLQTVNREWGS